MDKTMRRCTLALICAFGVGAFYTLATAQEAEVDPAQETDFWRAWAVTEGKQTKLVVEGIYLDGGPGKVVQLSDAVPPGTNPKILLLTLKTAVLPGVWPTVVRPVPASYEKKPYKKDLYTGVQIRYPNGDVITVAGDITDAGAGPK